MRISPARTSAYDILLRIEKEQAYSSALLPTYEERLSDADRGLCHELVLGSLRRQIALDREIDVLSKRRKLDLEVRIALRLGLYQLRWLTKIPSYSSINESVNLVQRAQKTSAKSFVNAVLRKASREVVEFTFADDVERISTGQSHPRWLIEKWATEMGLAEAEKFAAANNEPPRSAFRVVGEQTDELAALLGRSRPSDFVTGCYISSEAVLRNDSVYVQDEASQMTAQAVSVPKGGKFLDVCAAPGGKTGSIAEHNAGANLIVAGDVHLQRVKFLRENCRRQGVNVSVLQQNAEMPLPFADLTFDTVLVDAPCSGTGTIRHNPEIRYSLTPSDFLELRDRQLRILQNASHVLKNGGLVVYSTCSVEREENEGVCERFMAGNSAFEKIEPNVPRRFITDEGFARTWPQRDDMDGFFIASFRRR